MKWKQQLIRQGEIKTHEPQKTMSDFIFIKEAETDSVYMLQLLVLVSLATAADHISMFVHFLRDGDHLRCLGGGGGLGSAAEQLK